MATFTMKLIINKKCNKVLYAEATKDLVDFLLDVFVKPLESTVRQLFSVAKVGCLVNLHKNVADDLSIDYLESASQTKKPYLLNPASFKNVYKCSNPKPHYFCNDNVSNSKGSLAKCPGCGSNMTNPLKVVNSWGAGFVKGQVTYMITDDLIVKPLSTGSSIAILNELNVKDVGCIQEAEVTFDHNQGMELLKTSLVSNTVLTDIFLVKKELV